MVEIKGCIEMKRRMYIDGYIKADLVDIEIKISKSRHRHTLIPSIFTFHFLAKHEENRMVRLLKNN